MNATGTTSTGSGGACSPKAVCATPGTASACIGLTDNTGKTSFGLRMAEIDFTAPAAFVATGPLKTAIAGDVAIDDAECNLPGTGTFSWLLQFDTTAGTLKSGGAKPASDPTKGYSFDTDMLMGLSLAPVVYNAIPDASGAFATPTGMTLNFPIFLDAAGSMVIVLPIKASRVVMGTLSKDENCIGTYNAATLDPANSCLPDATHPLYTDGGVVDGYISLKDADNIIIPALNESLCVLLSGNPTMYGTQKGSSTVCTTDAGGNIVFQGDWCDTTNSPAGAGCADSVSLKANFAASSVLIQ